MSNQLPEEFLLVYQNIKNKRAKIVIDHIISSGYITTEDLQSQYHYSHPPRAIRDVRELGIPVERFWVNSRDGRRIAAYRFGDLAKTRNDRASGRVSFTRDFKKQMLSKYGSRCAIYQEHFGETDLQIDHRIPYEIAGDADSSQRNAEDYMLLCGSANRLKSWSCEHCENWRNIRSKEICQSCYWAYPDNYNHIAMQSIRRVDIIWAGEDVNEYDELERKARSEGISIKDYLKRLISAFLKIRD